MDRRAGAAHAPASFLAQASNSRDVLPSVCLLSGAATNSGHLSRLYCDKTLPLSTRFLRGIPCQTRGRMTKKPARGVCHASPSSWRCSSCSGIILQLSTHRASLKSGWICSIWTADVLLAVEDLAPFSGNRQTACRSAYLARQAWRGRRADRAALALQAKHGRAARAAACMMQKSASCRTPGTGPTPALPRSTRRRGGSGGGRGGGRRDNAAWRGLLIHSYLRMDMAPSRRGFGRGGGRAGWRRHAAGSLPC